MRGWGFGRGGIGQRCCWSESYKKEKGQWEVIPTARPTCMEEAGRSVMCRTTRITMDVTSIERV